MHKCQRKIQTFQGKICLTYQCLCLMQANDYSIQLKNNPERHFPGQILTKLFLIYWISDRRNWKKYLNLQEIVRWSDIEPIKSTEFILGTAILEQT